MKFNCLFCGGIEGNIIYEACSDYYLGKPYIVSYYHCTNCHLVQQFPIPNNTTKFYNEYPMHMKKSFLHRIMQKIVMAPVYYKIEKPCIAKVLLDYGCGNGWFLETLKGKGMELVGFEPDLNHSNQAEKYSSNQAEKYSEFRIFNNLDLLFKLYEGKVDILTMHFVMEHLPNLSEAFNNVAQLLRPGGIFFFTIPNFDSLESRIFGKKWHNLDPPRHLSFPNEMVIRKLSDRYGFRWLRRRSLPFPNGFAGSIPVLLSGRFRYPIFLLSLPFGIIFSRLAPDGIHGYWLVKE